MKHLASILLIAFCLISSSTVIAQQKRIFLFEAGNSIGLDSAKDAISSVFSGEVELGKALPAGLSSYDLIYVYGNPAQPDHIRLVEHLKGGGKVFLDMWPNFQPNDVDSLLNLLGLRILTLL